MMKKIGVLLLSILLTPVLAAVFGVLHDQVTYTFSPEYFTMFKFEQFGFWEHKLYGEKRVLVSMVGVMATWWTGLIIGIVYGFVGLIHADHKIMIRKIGWSLLITLIITILFTCIGFVTGYFFLSEKQLTWHLPEDLPDKKSFITVGTMHNCSYLGGLFGLIAGLVYLVRNKLHIARFAA